MAADDQTETFVSDSAPLDAGVVTPAAVVLPGAVGDWLAARVAGAVTELRLAVSVSAGRWFFRVESGASASTIEVGARGEFAPAELASAARRWARGAGLSSRAESNSAAEARLSIIPPAATRS